MSESCMPEAAAPGELERLLRGGLEGRGLTCELKTYGTGEDRPVEELLVRNPGEPGRGTVRIYPDGAVVWEFQGTISTDGADPILDEVTSVLRGRPGPDAAPGGSGRGASGGPGGRAAVHTRDPEAGR
jgi:hypothetical protein